MEAQRTAASARRRRRRILGLIAGCAGSGLAISTLMSAGRAQATTRLGVLLLIEELQADFLYTLEWAQWTDEVAAALRADRVPPATPTDLSFGLFTSKLDEAQDKVRAISVPVPAALPPLPVVTAAGRDERRRILFQAGAPLLQVAADAGELREAATILQRVGKQLARQTSLLQQSSDVLRDLVPKLTAPFIDQQLTYHWLHLELIYLPKSRTSEALVESKLNDIKASQLQHTAQVKEYAARLMGLLATEQAALRVEQEELERETNVLDGRKQALDARRLALEGAQANLRRLQVEIQAAVADIQQTTDTREHWLSRLDEFQRSSASLKEQLARPFDKCPEKYPLEECTHTAEIAAWKANQAAMRTALAQAERNRVRAEAEVHQADELLDRLGRFKAQTEARAAQLNAALARDSAQYQGDLKRLLEDYLELNLKRHRTRADVYFHESQQQGWQVERYLKAAP